MDRLRPLHWSIRFRDLFGLPDQRAAQWRQERGVRLRFKRALSLLRENSWTTVLRFELNELLKRKQTMRVRVSGVELTVRTCSPDLATASACLQEGEFDNFPELLKKLKFGFIIDAGGYIGTAAIALARIFPSATVVSIEPSSENFKLLEQNVRPFINVIAVNKALLDSPKTVELRNRGTGEWGYTVVGEPLDCRNAPALQSVPGTTVEELLVQYAKEGIDIMKLDIEGAEKDVLEASGPWIQRTAILIAELHDRIVQGCSSAFLRATAGFEQRTMKGGKLLALNHPLL